METSELRQKIDELIAAGECDAAARRLCELWRRDSGTAAASYVVARYEKLRGRVPLLPYRLAVLRSFTVEPLMPLLRAACFVAGVDLSVHVGEFNAYAQELLGPNSPLDEFEADAAVLAVQTRDVAPDLWRDFADLKADEREAIAVRVAGGFRDWVRAFRERSRAHLIIHTLEEPTAPSQSILDAQDAGGQAAVVRRINDELRRFAAEQSGVYVLDYDALVARHGRALWHDERKWLAARLPFAASSLSHAVAEWMRFIHPLTGKIAKALAVDLDNTLWGGVVGEDGLAGLRLGAEYPGAAYLELQRTLLDLQRRGILLCVCSKNNPEDALEALAKHPGMLLRPRHFAAVRVNWKDKADNLREIARELNIGTDALAFLDDNPFEREHVRAELPEVTVIELPDDPLRFAQAVRDCPVFERLSLSTEDRERGSYYVAERERANLGRRRPTREDFYRNLRQEAEVAPVTPLTLRRVAQLTQKTNQFNLTTRRYTEQQIEEMSERAGWHVLALGLRDRFGDNGLVGVAIVRECADAWEIDTFLLSCRVIGRTVETALLSDLTERARARGAKNIQGRFFPTKKNAPAVNFYPAHGFSLVEENEGGSLWALDLSGGGGVECPAWIRLTVVNGEQH
ncbi:MAG: HAD-IIIC family phosphatase [Acidobacteria bacterium]|nr:HAD-IIIC family phosphatase [Acidobacteriota bacterium]